MPLETSEMNKLGKMLLLVNRWLAQIHLVAPGGPSKEAKAEDAWPKLASGWSTLALWRSDISLGYPYPTIRD